MKVKIQYTVDIDDVPEEVRSLTERSLSEISAASDLVANLNANGSIAEYEKMGAAARTHMLNADLIISDCVAILTGYAAAKHSAAEPTTVDASVVQDG